MTTPYIGEVRLFAGNFAPQGWALCNGQLLSITENEVLYTLIGTTYGGDGQSTFGLPDLRGRLPVHAGGQFVVGQPGGTETVSLTTAQLPAHQHAPAAVAGSGNVDSPKGAIWAGTPDFTYAAGTANQPMATAAVASTGGSQPHDNVSPFLVLSFIIALQGVYPSQS